LDLKKRLIACMLFPMFVAAQERAYDDVLFTNSRMEGDYFYSKTAYQSPSWINNIKGKLPVNSTHYFTPGNSLQLKFSNAASGTWNAEIMKQQWRGQDIKKEARVLSFFMYVASPATTANDLPAVQLRGEDSTVSTSISIAPFLQSYKHNAWQQVIMPLPVFGLSYKRSAEIIGVVFSQHGNDGKEHTVHIDDIELLPASLPVVSAKSIGIKQATGYAKHIDLQWAPIRDTAVKYVKIYRSSDGKKFEPVGIQAPSIHRFADFVNVTGKTFFYKIALVDYSYNESTPSSVTSATTKSMTDEELLTMVQEASFRFYWEGAEAASGLAKESIPGRHNMIATGASGFGLMALIAGAERKFITREQAVERFLKIVNFLEKADKFHGAVSHFIDGPSGKVEPFFGPRDNGGDLVETSFLMQGLITARAYFNKTGAKEKEIRDKITKIWQDVEWSWYRRYPQNKYLFWHWSPDNEWIINHQLIGWNETMVTYLMAIASPSHGIPSAMYYSGWASQDTIAQQYRSAWGQTKDGSMYTNGNTYYGIKLDVGVSNGGPLFFVQYAYLGFDPHLINDAYTNYFNNNKNIALINQRYCIENPGGYLGYSDSCWGLTASDGPFGYSASEPVVHIDNGKVAPTGAISSFAYTPQESMKALKNYYFNYGKFLWGEYGFRDAFNLNQNWCSEIYMGLNQAPMTVMIENYRTGLLWKLFMSDPEIKQAINSIQKKP
jgi:hypothetical protein